MSLIKNKNNFLLSIFIISFFVLFGAINALAADNTAGLIVSPPTTEKEVKAGDKFQGNIKITNPNATTELSVNISVEDFAASGEDGQQTFIEPSSNDSNYSLGKWITTEEKVDLKANESREISYTITVPENAEPGGHYGVIFFSPSIKDTDNSVGSNGVVAVPKVGALFLLTVPGDIKNDGKIIEFSADKKLYIESTNIVNFLTRFQNLGTNHVKPQGNIVIKNVFGKQVANLQVNEKSGNVLPESIRKFENEWQKKWGFGPYRAELSLNYGENGNVKAQLSFWIIPWKETLIAIILLILLIWILRHLKWNTKQPVQTIPLNDNPVVNNQQNNNSVNNVSDVNNNNNNPPIN